MKAIFLPIAGLAALTLAACSTVHNQHNGIQPASLLIEEQVDGSPVGVTGKAKVRDELGFTAFTPSPVSFATGEVAVFGSEYSYPMIAGSIALFNPDLQLIWRNIFPLGPTATVTAVAEGDDGFIYAAGQSKQLGDKPAKTWVIKLDHTGKKIWHCSVGKVNARPTAIRTLPDGSVVLVGTKPRPEHGYHVWFAKVGRKGALVRQKTMKDTNAKGIAKVAQSGQDTFVAWETATGQRSHMTRINRHGKHIKTTLLTNFKTPLSIRTMATIPDRGMLGAFKTTDSGLMIGRYDLDGRWAWETTHEVPIAWSQASSLVTSHGNNIVALHEPEGNFVWLAAFTAKGELLWEKTVDKGLKAPVLSLVRGWHNRFSMVVADMDFGTEVPNVKRFDFLANGRDYDQIVSNSFRVVDSY
ncbi:hypothetical protein N9K16_00160 [Alphaproteobacteria bacterium]|jgi:hypothetical protein|nr:hypothetical protein [Alphaproteobacteria bacterium]